MIATLTAATLLGIHGHPVAVEVHVANGLPMFTIVGLADLACREARDRVRAAVLSSGLSWPMKRITVNLAPADLRKLGSGLDLAIAIGVLVAERLVPGDAFAGVSLLGELGLDGSLRPVPGMVPLVDAVPDRTVVVPAAAAGDAACVPNRRILAVNDLRSLIAMAQGEEAWPVPAHPPASMIREPVLDLEDVRGQPFARAALEVAAAGGHHLLLSGSPGSGKTMLAKRLPHLLPALSFGEALDVLRIRSAAQSVRADEVAGTIDVSPPFRSPHHSSSMVSLLGGGTMSMRPGELSLAHHGVLFLDELSEFGPSVLDSLRQPLEEGVVRVARARATVDYPARFQLVAATNPCPCGWRGAVADTLMQGPVCSCSPAQLERMGRRLSGPLLDRIDVRVDVRRPDVAELLGPPGESTVSVAARIAEARALALRRGVTANAHLPAASLARWARFDDRSQRFIERRLSLGALTARGMDRVRRVARTIQDLAIVSGAAVGSLDDPLTIESVSMAVEFRRGAAVPELMELSR
jgi:magnesium chelatase family protein